MLEIVISRHAFAISSAIFMKPWSLQQLDIWYIIYNIYEWSSKISSSSSSLWLILLSCEVIVSWEINVHNGEREIKVEYYRLLGGGRIIRWSIDIDRAKDMLNSGKDSIAKALFVFSFGLVRNENFLIFTFGRLNSDLLVWQ
jgi:hypothetical protein